MLAQSRRDFRDFFILSLEDISAKAGKDFKLQWTTRAIQGERNAEGKQLDWFVDFSSMRYCGDALFLREFHMRNQRFLLLSNRAKAFGFPEEETAERGQQLRRGARDGQSTRNEHD
jgi:hypothetical protein